jgi:O-antigen/teichoic acid export membrane protein
MRKNLPSEIIGVAPKMQSAAWWASALPMALTEGMRVLQGHMAILLLGFLATVSMVGTFRVASSVALVIAVPTTLLNVVGAPIIARLHAQGDNARSQRLLSWIALGMTSCTLILTIPFIVAGAPLLSFVFGEEFGDANTALLVLCGGAVFSGFYGASAVVLNMTSHQSRVTRASAVSLVLLALIAPPLILMQGVVGAAIATAFSMLIWNFLMWRDAQRLLALDTSLLPLFNSTKHHV